MSVCFLDFWCFDSICCLCNYIEMCYDFQIVSEPPPLCEIPPDCDPLTCDVIRGGLVKEPGERHSASQLLHKTVKALRKGSKCFMVMKCV